MIKLIDIIKLFIILFLFLLNKCMEIMKDWSAFLCNGINRNICHAVVAKYILLQVPTTYFRIEWIRIDGHAQLAKKFARYTLGDNQHDSVILLLPCFIVIFPFFLSSFSSGALWYTLSLVCPCSTWICNQQDSLII